MRCPSGTRSLRREDGPCPGAAPPACRPRQWRSFRTTAHRFGRTSPCARLPAPHGLRYCKSYSCDTLAPMNDVAIIGVGLHPFGRFEGKSAMEMGVDALFAPVADAAVEWKDVQFATGGRWT